MAFEKKRAEHLLRVLPDDIHVDAPSAEVRQQLLAGVMASSCSDCHHTANMVWSCNHSDTMSELKARWSHFRT